MLKDLEFPSSSPTNKDNAPRASSPTTEAMKSSLQRIGGQKQKSTLVKANNSSLSLEMEEGRPMVQYNNETGLLMGKKPCARDGQACCLVEGKLLVFGGDRHLMSFADLYLFNLD